LDARALSRLLALISLGGRKNATQWVHKIATDFMFTEQIISPGGRSSFPRGSWVGAAAAVINSLNILQPSV
jgi:hypothetical protein